jgi:hypothetical protein
MNVTTVSLEFAKRWSDLRDANTCSHLGRPLGQGEREGDMVTCGSRPA